MAKSKTVRYYGKPDNTIARLKAAKRDFFVVETTKTTNVKTGSVNYLFAEDHYFGRIFGLLYELKKQLDDNKEAIQAAEFNEKPDKVKYFFFQESIRNFRADVGTVYDIPDVIEADISMAYYATFRALGFIDEAFYEKCKNLDKQDRLILIGSVATIKTIEQYIGGKLVKTVTQKNDLHRAAWFKACSYVDAALLTLKERFDEISKDIFLFYWVDGIYFRDFETGTGYTYKEVFNELKQLFPFEWKVQKMKRVRLANVGDRMKIQITKPNGKRKLFTPTAKNIRLYYLDKDGKPMDIPKDLLSYTLKFK